MIRIMLHRHPARSTQNILWKYQIGGDQPVRQS